MDLIINLSTSGLNNFNSSPLVDLIILVHPYGMNSSTCGLSHICSFTEAHAYIGYILITYLIVINACIKKIVLERVKGCLYGLKSTVDSKN